MIDQTGLANKNEEGETPAKLQTDAQGRVLQLSESFALLFQFFAMSRVMHIPKDLCPQGCNNFLSRIGQVGCGRDFLA